MSTESNEALIGLMFDSFSRNAGKQFLEPSRTNTSDWERTFCSTKASETLLSALCSPRKTNDFSLMNSAPFQTSQMEMKRNMTEKKCSNLRVYTNKSVLSKEDIILEKVIGTPVPTLK